MGYRSWFLALRALHHARAGAGGAGDGVGLLERQAAAGAPVCADDEVRAELRRSQSLRTLAARRRRAIGATAR